MRECLFQWALVFIYVHQEIILWSIFLTEFKEHDFNKECCLALLKWISLVSFITFETLFFSLFNTENMGIDWQWLVRIFAILFCFYSCDKLIDVHRWLGMKINHMFEKQTFRLIDTKKTISMYYKPSISIKCLVKF